MVFDTKKEAQKEVLRRKKGYDKEILKTSKGKDITTSKDEKAIKERVKMLKKAKNDIKIRKRKFKDGVTLYFVEE